MIVIVMRRFIRAMAGRMGRRQQMLGNHALGNGDAVFAEGIEPGMGYPQGATLHD